MHHFYKLIRFFNPSGASRVAVVLIVTPTDPVPEDDDKETVGIAPVIGSSSPLSLQPVIKIAESRKVINPVNNNSLFIIKIGLV